MWKYHRCYGFIINRTIYTKKLFKNGLVFHWCLYNKWNTTWSLGDTKFSFLCWKKYFTCSLRSLEEKFCISARPPNILYILRDAAIKETSPVPTSPVSVTQWNIPSRESIVVAQQNVSWGIFQSMHRQHFKRTCQTLQTHVGQKDWFSHKALWIQDVLFCLFRWALLGPGFPVYSFFSSDKTNKSNHRQPQ